MARGKRSAALCKARTLWPSQSNAEVHFLVSEQSAAERLSRRLFQRKLQPFDYAGLVGAPDDACVEVGTLRGMLYIELNDPIAAAYHGYFYVQHFADRLVLLNEGLSISFHHLRGHGFGLCMFCRQVQNALRLGIQCIKTTAGRHGDENGYYTWPRFGFDGSLPMRVRRKLPNELRNAKTVLDLMASEHGRLWWRENGETIRVTFELSQDSHSRKVLQRYLAEKTFW